MDNIDNHGPPEPESFEEKIKDEIWCDLVDYIDSTDYTQAELAQILNVHQSDVSNLLCGKLSKFSTDRLIRFAGKLNLQVNFKLSAGRNSPRKRTEACPAPTGSWAALITKLAQLVDPKRE